jgi:hypothetical protein
MTLTQYEELYEEHTLGRRAARQLSQLWSDWMSRPRRRVGENLLEGVFSDYASLIGTLHI